MDKIFLERIQNEAKLVVSELLEIANYDENNIFVLGCSSSEIIGQSIGKNSSYESAKAVFEAIYPLVESKGLFLAVQCCEHLNRALVVSQKCAKMHSLPIVTVVPAPKAGGSMATVAYENFQNAVVVEEICATLGIDIGKTLIGMHLKKVCVPVRTTQNKIGYADIVCAKTRPKYIGGPRANYAENLA